MKKSSTNAILAISIAVVGLIWLFAVVAYTEVFELPWLSWGSIVCVMIAIIAAELYLLVFRKELGVQGTEPGAIGIIFTVCFLLVVILLNSIFVVSKHGDFNWVLLTLNLVVVAGYIVLLLWVDQSNVRLAERLRKTEEKTILPKEISRKLGELLAITEDTEIRGKLLKLKEAVDYSTNISTNVTNANEIRINEQLDELAQLTIGRADRLIILTKIEAAEMTWKMRSSTASSLR